MNVVQVAILHVQVIGPPNRTSAIVYTRFVTVDIYTLDLDEQLNGAFVIHRQRTSTGSAGSTSLPTKDDGGRLSIVVPLR
jgi:hypothetical protein